jgi:hypothetical protein
MLARTLVALRVLGLGAFAVASLCGLSTCSHPVAGVCGNTAGMTEAELRECLGVPADAKVVVFFGQAAHLDIDWQMTFDDYYASYVHDIFDEARGILDQEPNAYYSVAEMGYLEHHVTENPAELAPLQADAARGALHVVGGGITSPDTLLPETELLFRDFLYGTTFAEKTLGTTPHAAWLPDSFGQSALAPDILSAAGFDSVGFSRIDGAPTILQVYAQPPLGPPPPAGSTDATLQAQRAGDFIWRGPGGGEVLAHWLPALMYCEGDDVDYDADLQLPGEHLGRYDTDPSFVDGQIDKYLAALSPTSPTPYVYVAVGCDFQHPKPDLVADLAEYNQTRYPTTGAWAVDAPFDIYMQLVAAHRQALPTLQQDLTPYFMGFYGSRPAVKRGVRDAARPFFEAEAYATALGAAGGALMQNAWPALEHLTFADHHDFVTGTATDEVVAGEQLPLLQTAQQAGQSAFDGVARALAQQIPPTTGAVSRVVAFNPADASVSDTLDVTIPSAGLPSGLSASASGQSVPLELLGADASGTHLRLALTGVPSWGYEAVDLTSGPGTPPATAVTLQLLDATGQPATGTAVQRVVLSNADVRAQWDASSGSFALTSLQIDGVEALSAPSFTLQDYADQGGLWRLGHEMPRCTFTPQTTTLGADTVTVEDQSALSATVQFVSGSATREARLDAGDRGLRLALVTAAAPGTTRTVNLRFAAATGATLATSQPGGFVTRTPTRIFDPTFWPAVYWASDGDWAILLRQSTGVHYDGNGLMELLTARDAQTEKCQAFFVTGSDPSAHRFEWYVTHVASPADAERQAQAFNRPLASTVGMPSATPPSPLPASTSLVTSTGDGIVSALKPAERGSGDILRVLLLPGPVTVTFGPALIGRTIVRDDAVERDLTPLGTSGTTLTLDAATFGPIATIRFQPPGS